MLKTAYDKLFIRTVLKRLNMEISTFDPGLGTDVEIQKSRIILECWRRYFQILYPIYIEKEKDRKKTIKQIHLIFGNELENVARSLFINATFFRVGVLTLMENVNKYK